MAYKEVVYTPTRASMMRRLQTYAADACCMTMLNGVYELQNHI
jgi:hypothetical protein